MGSSARLGSATIGLSLVFASVALPQRAGAGIVPCSATDLVNTVQSAVTAGGPQTIDLSPACTYTLTAVHSGAGTVDATGLPYINNMTTAPVALTINGNGATITRSVGAPQFRFFLIFQNNALTLNNLTLSGGRAADNAAPGGATGGAIANGGTLTLNAVTLNGNRAGDGVGTGSTGGSGGALSSSGSATIVGSTISNNTAGNGGGMGATPGIGGFGGGIVNFGTLEITSSLLHNNTAGNGGMGTGGPGAGGGSGGAISNGGMLTILASTINGNSAGHGGASTTSTGGAGAAGGGIATNLGGTLNLSSSTVSNNTAGDGGSGQTGGAAGGGGGIFDQGMMATVNSTTITGNAAGAGGSGTTTGGAGGNGGGMFALGTTTLANSTISGNVAGNPGSGGAPAAGGGGGLYSGSFNFNVTNCTITGNGAAMGGGIRVPGAGVPQLRNTIVADNLPGVNCSGSIGNVNNNLDSGMTCGFGSANDSISDGNPNLGPLQDNGGFTFTHALLEPSDAVDAGNEAACAAAPVNGVDQRGTVRPQGAQCDIGAFETGAAPATATSTPTSTVTATLAATPTTTSSAGECAGPSSGRVSCWKAEGNADDSIGSNDGTLVGNTVFAPGIEGQAFRFDGTDDGINLGNPANLNLQTFTITAWIRRSSPSLVSTESQDAVLFSYGLNGYAFGLYGDGRVFLSKAQVNVVDSGSLRINDTRFHHVAVVQNAGSTVFYVDGVASAQVSYDPGFSFDTDAAIGLRPDISSNGFFGDVDEVQIWNRGLSPGEIQDIVDAVSPAECDLPQVAWAGNGHLYRPICAPLGVTWEEANVAAQAAGGYLATIATAEENLFVFSLIDDPLFWFANLFNANIGPWLGGFQPPGSPEPGGGFSWVTGEPFLFTAWAGGEPSNSGGTENRVHFYHGPAPSRGAGWNDVTDTVPILGYVIEWDDAVATPMTSTPSPTATGTLTATSTAVATFTTATPSNSNTPTRSATATPILTPTPTQTVNATATRTATVSPTHSVTMSPTPTQTASGTPTRTATATPSRTPTHTPSMASTATATISPTPPAGFVTIVGQVLRPRRQGTPVARGQEVVPNAPVEVFRCERPRRKVCLQMPGASVASGISDERGLFFLQMPIALLGDGVFVISATIDGVTLTKLRALIVILGGPGAGSGAGALDEIVVDVVSEAGVLLIDEEGLENFADEGVGDVLEAVDVANEDADFEGVGDEEAVAAALTTAEADPDVQATVEENRQIPCGGDCDGGATVTVDEIIRGVNIALGIASIDECLNFDLDASGSVTVDEIVTAVNHALTGCPAD